jgi:hypothetical protein|tara:strand:- start:37 stop:219 length:183 start_codon:yes stop_codon:yes gene_type:complete
MNDSCTPWGTNLVEERVEKEIQKGFDSPVKGWSMLEVLDNFEGNDRDYARQYLLNRCNIM